MTKGVIPGAGARLCELLHVPTNRREGHDIVCYCIGCTSCAYVCPTGAIEIIDDLNHPVDAKLIRNYGMRINAEMATLDAHQCDMRSVGTANIVDVMQAYDLLPVMNYQYGSHPDAVKIGTQLLKSKYFTQGMPDGCWKGCSMACAKTIDDFELKTSDLRECIDFFTVCTK